MIIMSIIMLWFYGLDIDHPLSLSHTMSLILGHIVSTDNECCNVKSHRYVQWFTMMSNYY